MLRRLLSLARDSRLALAGTVLCGFLTGLLIIAQASALSRVIAGVFLDEQSLSDVTGLLRLLIVIVLLRAGLSWVSEVSANAVAVKVKDDLRRRLFDKLLRLGPAYTRRERTGELVNVAMEGVEALDAYFSQYLPQLAVTALVPLSILIIVFPLDPLSGLILFLTAPLIPVFMYLIGKGAEALTKRQWDTLNRLSAHFLDSLQGLTTLKELGRSKEHARSIAETSERFRDVTMGVLRVTFLSALVLELVATVSTAVIAVEVGLRLLYGHLDFQPALFLLLLAPEFYIPLRTLGARFHAGMSGTTAARRIFEVLDFEEGNLKSEPIPASANGLFESLGLSNVTYSYPEESQPALRDISFEVKAGEHIALVGSSGTGKTTLAALLLRFIEPDGGQIHLNGQASTDFSLESWRAKFSWVPQSPYIFNDTIAANLRLARPEATQEELVEAAHAALLDEFIRALPEGLETVVGESGARLSGGEAQRLALARAFLKDAPILILDEPTSSLDPENETLLEEATRRVMHGRTVITIAHRLNTVYKADRIVVLEQGHLVELGTHRQLLARKGPYAQFVGISARVVDETTKAQGRRNKELAEPVSLRGVVPETQPISHRSPTLFRLLSFLRGSVGWVALSVLLGVLTIGSNVGLMGTSAFLISAAALHPDLSTLQVAIVGVRFFGIVRGVFRYTERLTSHNVTFRLLARLRVWFFKALESLAPARLMQYRSGDILSRIVADIGTLENFYVRAAAPPLEALVVGVGMAVFYAQFDLRLAGIYSGFMLLLGLSVPLLVWGLGRRPGRALVSHRAALHAHLVDGIQGLPDLLAFGRGADFSTRLAAEGKIYGKVQRSLASLTGLSTAMTVLLVNSGMLVVLAFSIPWVADGRIPGTLLAVLTLAALAGFEAVMPLSQTAQMLSSSSQAAGRLFEIVDTQPVVEDRSRLSGKSAKRSTDLRLENLSFAYPGQDQYALEDISLRLEPGKRLAIVGPSGAGKSTLVNLLLRFWDYSQGRILIAGHDLHEFPQEQVRGLFSVISQRTYFFNDTIRQNLLLARPTASESRVREAAQQAQIHDFIMRQPDGYDTMIGERGLRLSGGERQRLAIARALLKNAPIFLLDEPTANLDPPTERAILDHIFTLAKDRSLILITHRLVGLEKMDEIVVLDHGRMVERGTHAGLLARGGLYNRLWNFQNRMLFD